MDTHLINVAMGSMTKVIRNRDGGTLPCTSMHGEWVKDTVVNSDSGSMLVISNLYPGYTVNISLNPNL